MFTLIDRLPSFRVLLKLVSAFLMWEFNFDGIGCEQKESWNPFVFKCQIRKSNNLFSNVFKSNVLTTPCWDRFFFRFRAWILIVFGSGPFWLSKMQLHVLKTFQRIQFARRKSNQEIDRHECVRLLFVRVICLRKLIFLNVSFQA